MSSFSLDGSPKLTTQQIFSTWKHSNSNKCNLEFFIFAHAGSDILELVVFNCDTSTEFEHVILSKKSVLTQVDDEVATRFEMARHNSADGSNVLATEEELLEECMNETIGEFVVQHVTVDPDDSNKISLTPLSGILKSHYLKCMYLNAFIKYVRRSPGSTYFFISPETEW